MTVEQREILYSSVNVVDVICFSSFCMCWMNAARFEPTTGSIEWHRLASVNVPKVEREGDLQKLKQFLPEVAVGMVREHK